MERRRGQIPDCLKQSNPIESLLGQKIVISPQTLINQGRLFSTQHWIDLTKVARALVPTDYPELDICAYISDEVIHGKLVRVVTVTEGHHRVGIAALSKFSVEFGIKGLCPNGTKKYPFNIITSRLKNQISCL